MGSPANPSIDDDQLTYAFKVLEENQDARWTFLFLHQPLWNFEDAKNWQALEDELRSRKYTAFAGHTHTYKYDTSDDEQSDHITLGTTGGTSPLRGEVYGAFDHVTWVTAKKDGPVIANLSLEGITDKYITSPTFAATFEEAKIFRPALWQTDESIGVGSEGEIELTIVNPFEAALDYEFESLAGPDYHVLSELPSGQLEPQAQKTEVIRVRIAEDERKPLFFTALTETKLNDQKTAQWRTQIGFLPEPQFNPFSLQ